ncbi:MAG: nucleotidyl transferase AbiEii/AbiGii toxin family protein [Gemmatimonadaceae bacterium]
MLAGRLAQAREGRAPGMTIKGGVALELRLRPTPRATDDIDIIVPLGEADLLATLDRALTTEEGASAPYEGFTFQRKGQVRQLGNGAIRLGVSVRYKGGSWTSISIDLTAEELPGVTAEEVMAIDLSPFGLQGPTVVPCLPLDHQIAQKIHGVTKPADGGRQNERAKDAADLLLIEGQVTDYVSLREVCVQVFDHRDTHPWPPQPVVHEHWRDEYGRYVADYALGYATLEDCIGAIGRFIARIDVAQPPATETQPASVRNFSNFR